MRKTRSELALVAALGLVVGGLVGGCAPDQTPTPSPDVETPTPEPTPDEDPNGLPPGFPDPDDVIGAEHVVEDGVPLFDGEPYELAEAFGACFEGDTGDVCGYSIAGLTPRDGDGGPAPSEATLLMLLSLTDRTPDGRAIWQVVDAIVARSPDGEPARLQACDGEDGVAFYAAGETDGEVIPVAAAWGANPEVTALVEREPDDLTCSYMGP